MRRIFLDGPLTSGSGRKILDKLVELDNESNEPIDLIINTPGGSANYCYAIIRTMELIDSPVHTYCIGSAYSAGGAIFMCGEPGHRYITHSSYIMLHMPRGVFELSDNESHLIEYREMQERIVSRITGKSLTEVAKDLRLEMYLKGQDAIAYGLADNLI